MKKINIIFGALSVLMLLVHGVASGLYQGGILPDSLIYRFTGGLLSIAVIPHMIFSLVLQARNSVKDKNIKVYLGLNVQTVMQNMTGILSIVFILLHVVTVELSYAGIIPQSPVFVVVQMVLFMIFISLVCIHLMFSLPRMFVSMGLILKESSYSKVQRMTTVLVSIFWVLFAAAQWMYL